MSDKLVSFLLVLLVLVSGCASTHHDRRILAGKDDDQQPHAIAPVQTQITGWNFDWDDNIFFMPTKIVVFDKTTGVEKPVTTADFAEIRGQLGKPGPWLNFETRDDPNTGSFRYFRDPPSGENYFLRDVMDMVENHSPEEWQGPSWDAFVKAMSMPSTALWTTIITARGHFQESIMEALLYLQKKKLIKYVPPLAGLYAVSNPKYKGSAANPSEIKAVKMKEILDRVQDFGINEHMIEVVTPDGKGKSKMHTWGFSDDDYGNFETAVRVLSEEIKNSTRPGKLGGNRWPDIKIVLFYTGKNNPKQKARVVVIQSDGKIRLRQKREVDEALRLEKLQQCQHAATAA